MLSLGIDVPTWETLLLFLIMIVGLISVVSFVLKMVGAGVKIIFNFIILVFTIIFFIIIAITIVDLLFEPGLWQNIFDWFKNVIN